MMAALAVMLAALAAEKKQAPDVLWIITDDQRADAVGAFNKAVRGWRNSRLGPVRSPNLDALAAEGVLFTNAYVNSPACAPSRASMQMGRLPFRSGVYGFEYWHNKADFSEPTIAENMRAQGYSTALFGKRGVRLSNFVKGRAPRGSVQMYDVEVNMNKDLSRKGFSDYTRKDLWKTINGRYTRVRSDEIFRFPNGTTLEALLFRRGSKPTEEEKAQQAFMDADRDLLRAYTVGITEIVAGESSMPPGKTLDGFIVEEMERYMDNEGKEYDTLSGRTVNGPDANAPAFINLGFHLPHTPVLPPASFREQFKNFKYRVPGFGKWEVERNPPQLQKLYEKSRFDEMTDVEKQQAIRDYYAFCAYGDELIGQAVRRFKEFAERRGREHLIVYVAGDHGWHLGEQGKLAKFAPWAASTHGAAIVVSSDKAAFPPGTVHSGFVEYVDFHPTILDAAGADLTSPEFSYLDGVSLRLSVNETATRDYTIGEMNHVSGPRAYMRTADFAFSMRSRKSDSLPQAGTLNKDVKWALEADVDEVELALYDLRIDPYERMNRATWPRWRGLAQWFRMRLGGIVLGDGRLECDWEAKSSCEVSTFDAGAHNFSAGIPEDLIPAVGEKQATL